MSERLQQLQEQLAEIRRRVEARHPDHAPTLPLPDLMPLVHARDLAQGRAGAIGTVNPRRAGLVNDAIQFGKRTIARSLNWLVRPQVEFNQSVLACVQSTIEALNEVNRSLHELSGQMHELRTNGLQDVDAAVAQQAQRTEQAVATLQRRQHELQQQLEQGVDLRTSQLRAEMLQELLRTSERLQDAHRELQQDMAAKQAETVRIAETAAHAEAALTVMHGEYRKELQAATDALQERFWAELDKVRQEYERIIHSELRTLRQRAVLAPAATTESSSQAATYEPKEFDYGRFSERFRGSEEYVKQQHRPYVARFAGKTRVLDIGCGRGEFLELLREAGIAARGIDSSDESIALCLTKGLEVEKADLFAYLAELPDESLDGIFCSQVFEHLPVSMLPSLLKLMSRKLQRGGVLLVETPNPESLAIFATHFYLDPTHQRPVPPQLLAFLLEEAGFGRIEVMYSAPAVESNPELQELPSGVREKFFGALDYACTGIRL